MPQPNYQSPEELKAQEKASELAQREKVNIHPDDYMTLSQIPLTPIDEAPKTILGINLDKTELPTDPEKRWTHLMKIHSQELENRDTA